MDAEDAILILSDISIPISYKYDLSVILEDVLILIESCLAGKSVDVCFGSNTFQSVWHVQCVYDDVVFNAEWHSVVGESQSDLNKIESVAVPRRYFLKQWSRLIKEGLNGVKQAGIEVQDSQTLREAQHLIQRIDAD